GAARRVADRGGGAPTRSDADALRGGDGRGAAAGRHRGGELGSSLARRAAGGGGGLARLGAGDRGRGARGPTREGEGGRCRPGGGRVVNVLMTPNTYWPPVGGVARSVTSCPEAFRRRGHRVLVVAPTFDGTPPDETDVVRIPAITNFNGSDFSAALPIPGLLS